MWRTLDSPQAVIMPIITAFTSNDGDGGGE
jgi:hypothetical protein